MTKPRKDTKEKNEMFMRSIEGELEQLHGTLHTTNTLLTSQSGVTDSEVGP